jgi:hypothetical protein
MKAFVAVLALAACSQATYIASPYAGYAGLPIATAGLPYAINGLNTGLAYSNGLTYASAYAAPVAVAAAPVAPAATQFNSADEFGNINYGYANINSAKHEAGNTYGGVSGSYSYVDANGITQTTNYIADGLGFRVAATNLPIARDVVLPQPVFDLVGPAPVDDTEEVKAAKAEFEKAFEEAKAATASRKRRQALLTSPLAISAPLAYNTASIPAARDAVLTKIQLNPGHAVAYIVN